MSNDNSVNPSGNVSPDSARKTPTAFEQTRPRRGSPEADAFLRAAVKLGASDVHLKSGQPTRMRIGGTLRVVVREVMPTEEFEARVFEFLNEDEGRKLLTA